MSLIECTSEEPQLPNFSCLRELNDYQNPTQLPFKGWEEQQYITIYHPPDEDPDVSELLAQIRRQRLHRTLE